MSDPESCGNCKFGQRVDISFVECRGLPPTPVLVGAGQNLAGQASMAVQLLRPRLASTEPACALWKFRAQIIDLSAAQPEAGAKLS